MARLLFLAFVASGLALALLLVFQPSRARRLGTNLRKLGYAYVAAVLISAAVRIVFGWGT